MASIIDKIAQIRQAVFGKDVRESIASSIEAINVEVESTTARQDVIDLNEAERISAENTRIENENNRTEEHTQQTTEVEAIKVAYDAATKANLSVEVSNARTDNINGKTYETLSDRLDDTASSLAENAKNFTNAKNPILTPTYDGSYQAMHPKVLYFPNGWGTGNWHYWMAMTPYTDTDDKYENPSILVSQTGKEFLVPTGLINPIDKPTDEDILAGAHMSDPHLVMVGNNMEIWYRYNSGNGDGTPNNNIEKIYKKTSNDGINWSAPMLVFDLSDTQFLSPSVIYEDNKYKLWYVSYANMYYTESTDGTTWTTPVKCTVLRNIYDLWHLDIIKTDLGYEAVISCYETDNNNGIYYLFYSKSSDGVTWSEIKLIISPSPEYIAWDNKAIYRSSIVKVGDLYKIYYSATRTGGQWYIGLTEGHSLASLRGYDINTFYDNANFWGNINLVDDKQIILGKTGTTAKLNKTGLSFEDNASSFKRNLISLVNPDISGVKLLAETDKDTLVVKNDANTNYGNIEVNSLILMHTLPALIKAGAVAYSATKGTIQICDGVTWYDLFCNGQSDKLRIKGALYEASIIASSKNGDTLEVVKTGTTNHANMILNSLKLAASSAGIAEEGTLAWNKTTKKPMYYNGTSWVDIG